MTAIKHLRGFASAASAIMALFAFQANSFAATNPSFSTRTSAGADWKVAKGLHLSAEYELRTRESLSGVERHQASIGLDYKICDYFKAGAEYIFIGHMNSSDELKARHRFSLNLTGQYDAGDWRFSLREKLQLTHKTYDVNPYQEVLNPLQLKSRFVVKYRAFKSIEPYAYFEVRNIFNAPRCSATWSETSKEYTDYKFLGYDDAYINRLRGALGMEWELSKQHSIDFTAMYNWTRDLEIDTNKKGTELKSLSWESAGAFILCVAYKFSF